MGRKEGREGKEEGRGREGEGGKERERRRGEGGRKRRRKRNREESMLCVIIVDEVGSVSS